MAFAAVSWNKKGSTPLPAEEMEALSIKKIVVESEMAKGSASLCNINKKCGRARCTLYMVNPIRTYLLFKKNKL